MHPKGLLTIAPFLFIISCISYSIIWGEHGWLGYCSLKKHNTKEVEHIDHLFETIKKLKVSIKNYEQDPFFTERTARCDLSLGYTNELVYLLPQPVATKKL